MEEKEALLETEMVEGLDSKQVTQKMDQKVSIMKRIPMKFKMKILPKYLENEVFIFIM